MPTRANLAATLVAVAPAPAVSGTTLTVATGKGARFSTPPFNATIGPAGASAVAFAEQAEIVRVTKVTGDELTIKRAFEGPNPARSVVVGDVVAETITLNEVESSLIVAPAPSGGDDSKAVQECYEAMGKAGILQLRAGTYKFDEGVKFRKYGCWLRGQGSSSTNVESTIVTAGTLVTCNSRTTAAIETSQSGSLFSDFAVLNNANLELGTLSETLSSSGAAITELPVNALAEAIPTATRLTTTRGTTELGTLSAALNSAGGAITKIKVNALASAIPNLTRVTTVSGVNTQVWAMTAEAAQGATEITVESQKPTFSFPIGSKLEGNPIQFWVLSAEAAKGATKIKVESLKPAYNFPLTTTKIEGGPFPGSYGIVTTRTNEAGEEGKTEGNRRGRYSQIDIEGFNINLGVGFGFQEVFTGLRLAGGVKYNMLLGDPTDPDAGEHFITSSWFCGTKKRKLNAHLRWESGGGVIVVGNVFNVNPECESQAQKPEYICDMVFSLSGKGTSDITVADNQMESFSVAGVHMEAKTGVTGLSNLAVNNNEIRSFSAATSPSCVAIEGSASGQILSVTVANNRLQPEGGAMIKLKNVKGYSCPGNVLFGAVSTSPLTLEGTNTGFPSNEGSTFVKNVSFGANHSGKGLGYLLFIEFEMNSGELAECLVESEPPLGTYDTIHFKAPQPTIYSYLTAEAKGSITSIKTKATLFNIPPLGKLALFNTLNRTETETLEVAPPGTLSVELKSGEKPTEIKVTALVYAIPNGSAIRVTGVKTNEQLSMVTSAEAKAGEEKIKIVEGEINFNYPVGTKIELPVLAGATEIHVVEKALSTNFAAATTVVEEAAPEKFTPKFGPYLIPSTQYKVSRTDGNTYKMNVVTIQLA